MLVAVEDDGRVSLRTPGSVTGGYEEKSALVNEDEVAPKSFEFFLSPATCAASSGRWPPRLVGSLDVRGPDSSNESAEGSSRCGSGGIRRRTPSGSPWRFASASRSCLGIRRRSPLLQGFPTAARIPCRPASVDVRVLVWEQVPGPHLEQRLPSNEGPMKLKTEPDGRPGEDSALSSIIAGLCGVAAPASWESRMVSCTIYRLPRSISFARFNKVIKLLLRFLWVTGGVGGV